MTQFIDLVPLDAQKKAEETEVMVKSYENYIITTNENYIGAAEHLKLIKTKTKELDDLRKSLTKPIDESKKKIMEFFQKPLDWLGKAENAIKSAMLKWQQEQERLRREEEARLAELQRKEAEKLAKRAEKAEAKGDIEKAEALKEQAQQTEMFIPTVAPKVEKVAGIQTKTIWKFRIVDNNLIPREYLIPNEKMLGDVARATKGTLRVAGIEFYSEEVIAANIR